MASFASFSLLVACLVTLAASQQLLFTSDSLHALSTCTGYRGRYDGLSVYHIAQDCGDRIFDAYHTGSVVQIAAEDDVILHVRPSDLDLAVFPSHSATSVLDSAQEALALPVAGITGPRGDQIAFTKSASARLIHLSSTSAFFSIPLSTLHAHLESLTRIPYAELTLVPSHDLPLDRSRLDEDRKRIQHVTDNLSFQSIIGNISASVKKRELKSVVRHLTGEDGRAGWSTRHSFTEGAVQAAHWLKEQYERTGATCHFHHYFTGFSPNVICRYEPLLTSSANVSQSPVVVIAAHYDDRGTWGYTRAPGGDDDGSGSTMLLNLARTIGEYGVRFKDIEVVLAAFSGEEQGLWGSRYYAKSLRDEGRDVLFMLQADMIAYRKPGEPMQLAFPDVHSIPEGRWLVGNVSRLYTPELVTGITPACCSDSQSFDDEGFASSWVFERNGPIADPKYHNSGDLSDREGYDFEQLRLITSTVIATLLSFVPFQV